MSAANRPPPQDISRIALARIRDRPDICQRADSRGLYMVSSDFRRQLEGYGLTTAEILYRMPDHPKILQTFVWQQYDLHPEFPELRKFLDFWTYRLDGKLYSVRVAHARLIKPAEIRNVCSEFRLN